MSRVPRRPADLEPVAASVQAADRSRADLRWPESASYEKGMAQWMGDFPEILHPPTRYLDLTRRAEPFDLMEDSVVMMATGVMRAGSFETFPVVDLR